jgi:hypothetical protein
VEQVQTQNYHGVVSQKYGIAKIFETACKSIDKDDHKIDRQDRLLTKSHVSWAGFVACVLGGVCIIGKHFSLSCARVQETTTDWKANVPWSTDFGEWSRGAGR